MSTSYTGIVRPVFDSLPITSYAGALQGEYFAFSLVGSAGGGVGTDKVFLEAESTTTPSVMRPVIGYDYVTLVITGTQSGKYLNIGAVTDNTGHSYSATITNSD
jgi:hypothetical protein